jgi:hypothetical protein
VVLYTPEGGPIRVDDMTWDQAGSFLVVATDGGIDAGGVAILSFSGSALTETVYPTGGLGVVYIQRTGSWVYAMAVCHSMLCSVPTGIYGFDVQGGQLNPLPGSPYPYGHQSQMVIY